MTTVDVIIAWIITWVLIVPLKLLNMFFKVCTIVLAMGANKMVMYMDQAIEYMDQIVVVEETSTEKDE